MKNSCEIVRKLLKRLGSGVSGSDKKKVELEVGRCLEGQTAILLQVAHQMQQPLALVRGYMELFLREPSSDSKKIIDAELLNMMGQVQKLLRFAQTEFGDGKLCFERTEIVGFLRGIFDQFVVGRDGYDFSFSVSEGCSFFVDVDRGEFSEVIQVFLENACKYVPDGGRIVLGVLMRNGELVISVKDNGDGISEVNQKRVFDSFFRGNSCESGTGLGLWIAKNIVDRHNGEVWVESVVGKGCEFFVRLPFSIRD